MDPQAENLRLRTALRDLVALSTIPAACDRVEFPDETDHLLLSVAANHAATAFQSARLIQEHRRAEEALGRAHNDLEMKVAARTAELRRTTAEALAAQRRFRDLVNS